MRAPLIGREEENAVLGRHLAAARRGEGSLLLLSGEAGVGKTRLLAELSAASGMPSLRGAPVQGSTTPYGPLAAVLRCHLQLRPGGFDGWGPLRAQLALLLPELGDPAAARADRATLHEALRCAFTAVAASGPAIVVLDDLHWSDEATLEVLAALAEPVRELELLVIAAYRSDGLPRHHGIRRLRHELRRAGLLDEVALAP